MDFINIVTPLDESELDAPATANAAATTPAHESPLSTAEQRLLEDLCAFDDDALLRLVRDKRDVTVVELHLADRLTSALEELKELEAMLQINQECPTAGRARRARLN